MLVTLFGLVCGVVLALKYACDVFKYHQAHRITDIGRYPPNYPSVVPFLGNIVSILWNLPMFIERATDYKGQLASSRISLLPGLNIFLFQDRETIREVWSKSSHLSSNAVYVFACKYLFGMPQKWVSMLAADNSGPYPKPHAMSNVRPENRAQYILSKGVVRSLAGSELRPTLERFRVGLISQVQNIGTPGEERIMTKDFRRFIHNTIGLSLIEAIFGPTLVQINPAFMDDLFELDGMLPWFAKGMPTFMIPEKYAVRQRMKQYFKNWYSHSRTSWEETSLGSDGDAAPSSIWIKQRLQTIDETKDEDTIASVDVGAAWASVTNIVAAVTMALLHIAEDEELVARVRRETESILKGETLAKLDLRDLTNNPLLSSIYAETLRLHVKSFTVFSSLHTDIQLGRYLLPKGCIGILDSGISHMDKNFWNTRDGSNPVSSFWADRFLIDPADPLSGPRRPLHAQHESRSFETRGNDEQSDTAKAHFSIDGLQESWFPFGGGHLICPGRFIARSVMTFTAALFLREFDITRLTDRIEFSSRSHGFGTEQPKHGVPVHLKRRNVDDI